MISFSSKSGYVWQLAKLLQNFV